MVAVVLWTGRAEREGKGREGRVMKNVLYLARDVKKKHVHYGHEKIVSLSTLLNY